EQLREKKARSDSLKSKTKGYPVHRFFNDTLFFLYSKIGSFSPKERAESATSKIHRLGNLPDFNHAALVTVNAGSTEDIVYGDLIVMSVTEAEGLGDDSTRGGLADDYRGK